MVISHNERNYHVFSYCNASIIFRCKFELFHWCSIMLDLHNLLDSSIQYEHIICKAAPLEPTHNEDLRIVEWASDWSGPWIQNIGYLRAEELPSLFLLLAFRRLNLQPLNWWWLLHLVFAAKHVQVAGEKAAATADSRNYR